MEFKETPPVERFFKIDLIAVNSVCRLKSINMLVIPTIIWPLFGKTNMDPIRLLLSLVLGLFPQLLHLTAIPLATVPRSGSRQQLRDFAIGHDWLGWYRVTLEVRVSSWPSLRVVAISEWSRSQPGRRGKTNDHIRYSKTESKSSTGQDQSSAERTRNDQQRT